MPLRLGAPTVTAEQVEQMAPLAAIRTLSSTYPSPTNAQAIAALDSFAAVTADQAIADGVREDVARSFYGPDGVLPRMRLLAWGWTNPGDLLRPPSDRKWWQAAYGRPLWNVLETLFSQLGDNAQPLQWDAQEAAGDEAELSRSYAAVVADDLPPVNEAPCPRYLIPPGRGQMPIPNPECLRKPAREIAEKIPMPRRKQGDAGWLLLLLIFGAMYIGKGDKR